MLRDRWTRSNQQCYSLFNTFNQSAMSVPQLSLSCEGYIAVINTAVLSLKKCTIKVTFDDLHFLKVNQYKHFEIFAIKAQFKNVKLIKNP